MKKILLFLIPALFSSLGLSAQQWLYFPPATSFNWVSLNDLDVAGDKITLEAIVTLPDTAINTGNDIISKHLDQVNANYLFRFFSFEITTTAGFHFLANYRDYCPDSTYHLAATYDGDSMKYYVNGIETASAHWTGSLILNNYNTAIGNRSPNLNEQFYGYINEVRIWNVARSQAQIAANIYDLPNPTSQQGLLAYYKFDMGYSNLQGNSAYDGVPYGNQLSIAQNPLFTGAISAGLCSTTSAVEDIINQPPFSVYPNPSKGLINVSLNANIQDNSHLIISDLCGRTIKEIKNITFNSSLELNLPSGIYTVTILNNNFTQTTKIVVQ